MTQQGAPSPFSREGSRPEDGLGSWSPAPCQSFGEPAGAPAPTTAAPPAPAAWPVTPTWPQDQAPWPPPQPAPAYGWNNWQDPYQAYPPGVAYHPMPQSSPFGIAAMIAGILSLFTMLPGPVALGLGIAGLRQVQSDPQRYAGTGMAVTGIATGAIGSLMLLLVVLATSLA